MNRISMLIVPAISAGLICGAVGILVGNPAKYLLMAGVVMLVGWTSGILAGLVGR